MDIQKNCVNVTLEDKDCGRFNLFNNIESLSREVYKIQYENESLRKKIDVINFICSADMVFKFINMKYTLSPGQMNFNKEIHGEQQIMVYGILVNVFEKR